MVFDYLSTFQVGQKLYNKHNQSFSILRVATNSLTLTNGHNVQMYTDNKLYYQFQDPNTQKYVFKEYFLEKQS